jgi:hypothetical protein
MPPKLAVRFRAICVAVALVLATASVVEAASAKDPLIGATRAQVLEKFGEPKNTIVAGNREVLLFERDRVTLRDNVVVQVERLPEPVRRPPPPPPEPVAPAPAEGTAPAAQSPAASPPPPAATAAGSTTSTVPAVQAEDPNAPLEVKVRSSGSRSAARPEAPKADTSISSGTSGSAPAVQPPAPVPPATAVPPVTTPPVSAPPVASTPTTTTADAVKAPEEPPVLQEAAKADETAAATPDDKKAKAKKKAAPRRSLDEGDMVEEPVFTASSYLIAAVTIGAGVGFLLWRKRQRQFELDATAVSSTPLNAPVSAGGASSGGGAVFTTELLSKLEWKRFEDLVVAYYSKTGVVASRTKTGPASPVHIKISWKGEPRPFALVQCLAGPAGLVDATRLQDLVTVLAAEDIRRGYVVTTGKFNVAARDFAEEKHITLLPGDILIEKINALPDAARNELMAETTAGDYATPSCPKCEQKMMRNPEDPTQWRCAAHPDQVIPVK